MLALFFYPFYCPDVGVFLATIFLPTYASAIVNITDIKRKA